MIELILLTILILIGVLWFKNLTDNSGNEDDPEIAALRKKHANKWRYASIHEGYDCPVCSGYCECEGAEMLLSF